MLRQAQQIPDCKQIYLFGVALQSLLRHCDAWAPPSSKEFIVRFFHLRSPLTQALIHAFYASRWIIYALIIWLCMAITPLAAAQTPLSSALKTGAPEAKPADAASAALLADILENETARNQLIEHLRQTANANPSTEEAPLPALAGVNWAINYAQSFVGELSTTVNETVKGLKELGQREGLHLSMQEWYDALLPFIFVLLSSLVTLWIMGKLASMCYEHMDSWLNPERQNEGLKSRLILKPKTRALIIFGGLLIDVAVVAVAMGAGIAVSAFIRDPSDQASQLDVAFLNTFFAVEIIKAMIRLIFAPRYAHMRLLDVPSKAAQYWTNWLSNLLTVTAYCTAIAGPLAQVAFSPAVGSVFGLLVMLGVYVYAIRRIWLQRRDVKIYILRKSRRSPTSFLRNILRMLAYSWHWLALGYFTALFSLSQLDPQAALPFMVKASFYSIITIAIGLFISNFLSTLITRHIGVSRKTYMRMPMLEARLNTYIPFFLRITRLLVMLSVGLLLLDIWSVFDLMTWLSSAAGTRVIGSGAQVLLVLAIALLVWTVLASLIEQRMADQKDSAMATSSRARTLLSLLRNVILVVIVAMAIMVILSQLGVNIAPLLAGAGVAGLAIGFGAQKLVQDIITGVFIQIENGMNQNDVVEVAGIFGTVEHITIRSVGIRTLDGAFHLIPFSSVDTVTNHMRDFSYHLGEYTVAYRESVDDAMYHLEQAFQELKKDKVLAPEILEDMTIPGVTSLNERGFTVRVLIKTRPGMQWAVQRGFNRLVKKHFNAANIELPYPQTVVYFGQNKDGEAPPMRYSRYDPDAEPQENSPAAGHTPRNLKRGRGRQGRAEDVLGNEMERTTDDEGQPLPDTKIEPDTKPSKPV